MIMNSAASIHVFHLNVSYQHKWPVRNHITRTAAMVWSGLFDIGSTHYEKGLMPATKVPGSSKNYQPNVKRCQGTSAIRGHVKRMFDVIKRAHTGLIQRTYGVCTLMSNEIEVLHINVYPDVKWHWSIVYTCVLCSQMTFKYSLYVVHDKLQHGYPCRHHRPETVNSVHVIDNYR